MSRRLPTFATAPVGVIAALVAAVLLAVSGRYGYHRDELYFLAAGHHLAWGYPDQPPLVPLVARAMSAVAPESLVVLRLPSVLAAVLLVVVTALIARELGGGRGAQALAAGAIALSGILPGACHLLSTTTFDLVAWAVVLWLVVRILRTGDDRLWPVVGLVTGVGLLDSDLLAFLAFGLAVGVLVAGPRQVFASRWLWLGVAVAVALWSPYLVWQAQHGWPQLAQSRAIAAGQSGTSEPRWLFLPFQLVMGGPFLAPVWIAGLIGLLRRRRGSRWPELRCLGVAWVVVAVVFLVTGGKPYYQSGFLPLLVAAGAVPVAEWLRRRARPRLVVATFLVLSLPVIPITLPVVPLADVASSHVVDLNYDAGEQIAWPAYVQQIETVYDGIAGTSSGPVQVVTGNYGEAGAVSRYWRGDARPAVFSGHVGYWYWGRPSASTVVAVGFSRGYLVRFFSDVRQVAALHNSYGVENDEQGEAVWRCSGLRRPWSAVWPRWKHT